MGEEWVEETREEVEGARQDPKRERVVVRLRARRRQRQGQGLRRWWRQRLLLPWRGGAGLVASDAPAYRVVLSGEEATE